MLIKRCDFMHEAFIIFTSLALSLLLFLPPVEPTVDQTFPYPQPAITETFRCYQATAMVYSNFDADTNCGEAECIVDSSGFVACKNGISEPSIFQTSVCATSQANATLYASTILRPALENMNTQTCSGNYTAICNEANGLFSSITDRASGTVRCCSNPRYLFTRQKNWKSIAYGYFIYDLANIPSCGIGNPCITAKFTQIGNALSYDLKDRALTLKIAQYESLLTLTAWDSLNANGKTDNTTQFLTSLTFSTGTTFDVVVPEYETIPGEVSLGQHVMCYRDEDCQGVKQTFQPPLNGIAFLEMCCGFCEKMLASEMCQGDWNSWPVGSVRYYQAIQKINQTCRTQFRCSDKTPCMGCPGTCEPVTNQQKTTTAAVVTTQIVETTPEPVRSSIELNIRVHGESEVTFNRERKFIFLGALAKALDVAQTFLDIISSTQARSTLHTAKLSWRNSLKYLKSVFMRETSWVEVKVRVSTASDRKSEILVALIVQKFREGVVDQVMRNEGFSGGVNLTTFQAISVDGVTPLQSKICGDGTTQTDIGEECDDGNQMNGDGCSQTCQVEYNWHCWHCQPEDFACNGSNTIDGCAYQGCQIGKSICVEVSPCDLWYGRCFEGGKKSFFGSKRDYGRCWSCMRDNQDYCLDCTAGFAILEQKILTRKGSESSWARTRGDLRKQPLPKWLAPYGFMGPCLPSPNSTGDYGSHPTTYQLNPASPNFPADPTGNSGGFSPEVPYGKPPICIEWTTPILAIIIISAFIFLLCFCFALHFGFNVADLHIRNLKTAVTRPDLPRPRIWAPVQVPGEDDVSESEYSEEEDELIQD